jgi:diguanylate cyclase (GGDEF)-like protein
MVSWWDWRKALFGKIDQNYREAFLREDKTQIRILIAIAAIWAIAFSYIEYLDLSLTPLFYFLTILRVLFVCASILFFIIIPKINNLNKFDIAILFWSIACVLLPFTSNLMRGNEIPTNVNINLVWILGFYLLIPNRQLFRIIPALLSSFISIYILLNYKSLNFQVITQPVLVTNISAAIAMNIIGLLASLRFDSQRYQQYVVQMTLLSGREQLKELVKTDSLTGILNRRGFFEVTELEFDRFKRYGKTFSFAMIDLDRLKRINDTLGHPAGDLSLQTLVKLITGQKRSTDMIGRLAGDEFGLLLPNTGADKALEILSRSKNALENTMIELPDKRQFQIHFSAGITEAVNTDESFDDIYRRADRALLKAKKKGRNQIEFKEESES